MKTQFACSFFFENVQFISEIRSYSATNCLPNLLDASVYRVSASQLFGRSAANFFNLMRVSFHIKRYKFLKDYQFFFLLSLFGVFHSEPHFVWRKVSFPIVFSWLERKVRDSCGKSVSKGDPTGAKSAEEAPGPPAESECLEWNQRDSTNSGITK